MAAGQRPCAVKQPMKALSNRRWDWDGPRANAAATQNECHLSAAPAPPLQRPRAVPLPLSAGYRLSSQVQEHQVRVSREEAAAMPGSEAGASATGAGGGVCGGAVCSRWGRAAARGGPWRVAKRGHENPMSMINDR